ncbi:tRNA-dependent cyclodipeptide synthase [Micromonospora sp. KC213]|uniref:tRNA-dependent cyclodipeptide synthase n=1 Tax=Micromonospora sp. KC213 TaxID=2530378 RepID=UPI001050080D|nr:tRNA-dependent cyclodipeptide synthase [Micromonospora sp. KC213]TDC44337.1 tRNA-dependent cyclodipeptide synthase [Micromonospora sp. KC213]
MAGHGRTAQDNETRTLQQGAFVVEPLTDVSRVIWEQRKHVVCGVSPGNSYFQVPRLASLLGWLRAEFERVDVIIPDSALHHTYLALGYEPQRAVRKARGETNVLYNRVVRAWKTHGGPRELDGLQRMSDLVSNEVYRERFVECEQALKEDRALWETCQEMSEEVLATRGYDGPPDTARIERAMQYLLAELPFFLASADIFGAPSSLNFYHQRLALAELIFSGGSVLEPSPRQGYATIYPAA